MHFQRRDLGPAIGRAAQLGLLHEVRRRTDAAAPRQWPWQIGIPGRDGFVIFVHGMVPEQRVVSVAGGRVDAEQDQPGRVAVDAVDRYQIIQTEPVFQAHQQGLMQVFARGYDRQKMRLVSHQQMGVAVQHGLLQRDRGFRFQCAEIVDARAGAKGCVEGQRFAIRVAHTAAGHALRPFAAVNVDKAGAQKIQ